VSTSIAFRSDCNKRRPMLVFVVANCLESPPDGHSVWDVPWQGLKPILFQFFTARLKRLRKKTELCLFWGLGGSFLVSAEDIGCVSIEVYGSLLRLCRDPDTRLA
jgi:hypothetical protein